MTRLACWPSISALAVEIWRDGLEAERSGAGSLCLFRRAGGSKSIGEAGECNGTDGVFHGQADTRHRGLWGIYMRCTRRLPGAVREPRKGLMSIPNTKKTGPTEPGISAEFSEAPLPREVAI